MDVQNTAGGQGGSLQLMQQMNRGLASTDGHRSMEGRVLLQTTLPARLTAAGTPAPTLMPLLPGPTLTPPSDAALQVYSNVEKFKTLKGSGKRKEPTDQLFDMFDAGDLNKELKGIMDGLSVKVGGSA